MVQQPFLRYEFKSKSLQASLFTAMLFFIAGCSKPPSSQLESSQPSPAQSSLIADTAAKDGSSPATVGQPSSPGDSTDLSRGLPTPSPSPQTELAQPSSSLASTPIDTSAVSATAPVPFDAPGPIATEPSTTIAASASSEPDFTNILLPPDANAKTTIEYLGSVDKALQGMLLTEKAGRLSREGALRQAAVLGGYKYAAGEQLERVAELPIHRELGILAKMEALAHTASLGDAKAAAKLREIATNPSAFSSQLVAHHAALILLGLELSDLQAGLTKAQSVLEQLDAVLKVPSLLKLPDFHASAQVVQVLEQHAFDDSAKLARDKVVKVFSDHPDPQIAMMCWHLNVSGMPEFAMLNQSLSDPSIPAGDTQRLIDWLSQTAPNSWTTTFLLQQLTAVEYSGQLDKAGLIASAIQEQANWQPNADIKRRTELILDAFSRRIGAMGKPLPLNDLELTKNGIPFDPANLQGKLVLVDFWASNCIPCRAEFPNLRELYAKYADQGFEIVGINLDESVEAMQSILAQESLPWVHARSSDASRVGFMTPQAVEFGVTLTPFMMLVGRDGKVMAIHTRGKVLADRLVEIFSQP